MGDGLADERVGNGHGAAILGCDVGQVNEPTTRNRHEPLESRRQRSAEHYSALEQIQLRDGQVTDSIIVIPGHGGAVGDKSDLHNHTEGVAAAFIATCWLALARKWRL